MVNKQLIMGSTILAIGILMLFFTPTKYIAPFLVGFSLPTLNRGMKK